MSRNSSVDGVLTTGAESTARTLTLRCAGQAGGAATAGTSSVDGTTLPVDEVPPHREALLHRGVIGASLQNFAHVHRA